MSTIRVAAVIESDGELHLKGLPCRKGDRVEAVVQISGSTEQPERNRQQALDHLIELSRSSERFSKLLRRFSCNLTVSLSKVAMASEAPRRSRISLTVFSSSLSFLGTASASFA